MAKMLECVIIAGLVIAAAITVWSVLTIHHLSLG